MSNKKRLRAAGFPTPLYVPGKDGTLQCMVCAHGCNLKDGQRGLCGVRARSGDSLKSLVYGRLVAEHIDPIEKKPIFHVLPGSTSYSVATQGCNFRCLHCQNASISQVSREVDVGSTGTFCHPETVVESALAGGCKSISYTYVEPSIFLEYAYDCCVAAKDKGLMNVFVSNGYMTDTVIDGLAPLVDAINIDLKSFSDSFYKKVCGAKLAPVLDCIKRFKELGVWVEVTTLVIPGANDSEQELTDIATFLAGIDREMPWHVSGFYPAYRMSGVPPTGAKSLATARQIGLEQGLFYVYAGNRPGSGGENSYCPSCGEAVILRHGFTIIANRLRDGCCPDCGMRVAGVWQ